MSLNPRRIGIVPVLLSALVLAPSAALAAGEHAGGHGQPSIGKPGKAAGADRTVEVVMDDFSYEPARIRVVEGETVRFVVRNEGTTVHEFNIGTPRMHVRHQDEMQAMVEKGIIEGAEIHRDEMKSGTGHGHGMSQGHANSVLLEPGKSAELVWTFTEARNLEFACNVPGHYEAGMAGDFRFVDELANR